MSGGANTGTCNRAGFATDGNGNSVSTAWPTATTLLTINGFKQSCSGSRIFVDATVQALVPAGGDLAVDVLATCTTSCGGVSSVFASPGDGFGYFMISGAPSQNFEMRPFNAVFPGLPSGTWRIDLLAYSFSGATIGYTTLVATNVGLPA